jgi:hypothetical protein
MSEPNSNPSPQPLIHRRAANSNQNRDGDLEGGTNRSNSNENEKEGSRPNILRGISSDEHPAVIGLRKRLKGHGKTIPSFGQSIKNICTHSVLNYMVIFIPLSWVSHFAKNAEGEPVFNFQAQFACEYPCFRRLRCSTVFGVRCHVR